MKFIIGAAFGLYVAGTLWAHAGATPADCVDIGTTGEGFPRVACADGMYYLDMDGQPYENAAGAPVYCPGVVWVQEAPIG